jgi:hypothetical protein
MRIYDLLADENTITEGDNFVIELEDLLLETYVVGFANDGVILAGDETMLAYLSTTDVVTKKTYSPIELAVMEGGHSLSEAEYQGHSVPLGKPMRGDVKKSKVYVKDPKTGNVKKVNFGDKKLSIKKHLPDHRKSFRARHHCENPGPRTKARYWSCRAW